MEQQYLAKIGELEALVESLRKQLHSKNVRPEIIGGVGAYLGGGMYNMFEIKSPKTGQVELYQRVYDDGK
jgi:hypothetical protein